ncbi:MAG: hypothetical protein LUI14_05665 [Lachnospiraceae bacterium]|nr:hypothetical protein [Lachnospiraceae bacterium]MCD7766515.1 hypothetical protein [Lachnospiraceae bacterium]
MDEENRDVMLHFRVSQAELERIRRKMEEQGMNNTIGMLLKVFIYALIIYQTNVLCKKRANAVTLEEQ